jgi:hypothetical protein
VPGRATPLTGAPSAEASTPPGASPFGAEALRDDAAEAHVTSDHVKRAQAELPEYVQETSKVRNVLREGNHWDSLGEFDVS